MAWVAAVGEVSCPREFKGGVEVPLGEREDVVEREGLRVSGPPAEEVVDVDDHAVWGAGVQPSDDGVGERPAVALHCAVDDWPGESGVGQCRVEQLGEEQIGDDDVRRRCLRRGVAWATSAAGRGR